MNAEERRPPVAAEALLRKVLPDDAVGRSVVGDLGEEYRRRAQLHARSAHRWYWREALAIAFHSTRDRIAKRAASTTAVSDPVGKGDGMLRRIWSDLRVGARTLWRTPGFTLVAAITLALGIGANTAIFSLVDGILLRPLPYDEANRLVGVWNTAPGVDVEQVSQSPALHFTYEDEGTVFEELGLWNRGTVAITGLDEALQEDAIWVTDGTFRVLRVQPVIGRRFSREDDTPDTPRTAILSYKYWLSRFAGDPEVLGRTLIADGIARQIIGIMPADFRLLGNDPAIYLPMRWDRSEIFVGQFSFRSLGRLKQDVTLEQATAEMTRLLPIAVEKFPGGMKLEHVEEARLAPLLTPLKTDVIGNVGDVLWVLLGTAAMVLLIACANVTNLSLVRAEGRDREVAVRTAMGAARTRIASQFITETAVLGVVGCVLGLGLAYGGLQVLLAMAPTNLPRLDEISISPMVLLFTVGVTVLACLAVSLLSLFRYGQFNLVSALKEGGRGASGSRQRNRARNALVVAQVALAIVLLIGSGLMVRSFRALMAVEPGFRDPESVLTLRVSIPSAEVEDLSEMAQTHEMIARRIDELPGVTSVGLSTSITMDGAAGFDPIFVEQFPLSEGQLPPVRTFKWIGEGYFATMGNPVLAGRPITRADLYERARVVVITENLALEYWNSPAEAIGKRIGTGIEEGDWRTIVGVVGNVRDNGMSQDAATVVYWPMITPHPWQELVGDSVFASRDMAYAIRSDRTGTAGFLDEIRQAIWSVNSNLPLANVRTLEDILDRSTARTSFTLVMLGVATAVALLLGVVGVYGVISYVVTQRTREIGVRIALGAQTGTVMKMVLRHGLILAGTGVTAGLLAALGLTRLMSSLLYGVNPVDAITYVSVAAGTTMIVLLASYLPARKAAAVDPLEALRAE
ncbi:MAG: ABC transporter permease [Gemmatimonadota bacterium]|nr:MAG: ABC transporter permease [Gemmatimonadota bacterium]